MKRYIHSDINMLPMISVTMYLHPIIYADSKFIQDTVPVASAVSVDDHGKYHTDINPSRVINGPLSDYGVELEPPISDEWNSFIEDCKWLIREVGFAEIKSERSESSKKSEYILLYGINDTPCGSIVYDLRISEHPFDATFPDEYKDAALEYLQVNKILDGTATKADIDFQIEKITVGSVKYDTWDRALNRLYNLLRTMKKKVQIRLKTRGR